MCSHQGRGLDDVLDHPCEGDVSQPSQQARGEDREGDAAPRASAAAASEGEGGRGRESGTRVQRVNGPAQAAGDVREDEAAQSERERVSASEPQQAQGVNEPEPEVSSTRETVTESERARGGHGSEIAARRESDPPAPAAVILRPTQWTAICWDCKRGQFKSQKNSWQRCRGPLGSQTGNRWALGHTGPDYLQDPRETLR